MTAQELIDGIGEMVADGRIGLGMSIGAYSGTPRSSIDTHFHVTLASAGITMKYSAPLDTWQNAVASAINGFRKLDADGYLPPQPTESAEVKEGE